MLGSLILPTTTGAAVTGTRRAHLSSSIPNNNYHLVPTISFSSPPNKLPARTRRMRMRILLRASSSSSSSFTTTAAAAAAFDTTTTLPTSRVVDLSSKLPQKNLYQILGIKQNASSLEIKTAYRKLAKQFHPDALPPPPTTSSSESDGGGGGARVFVEIHNAYATLSDPTERARYDLSIQIHTTRTRFHTYYSSSSSTTTAVDGNEDRRRRRSYGMPTTRRWETDQCW